jgi:hypothetical protein
MSESLCWEGIGRLLRYKFHLAMGNDYLTNNCQLNVNSAGGINFEAYRKGIIAEAFIMFLLYFASQLYRSVIVHRGNYSKLSSDDERGGRGYAHRDALALTTMGQGVCSSVWQSLCRTWICRTLQSHDCWSRTRIYPPGILRRLHCILITVQTKINRHLPHKCFHHLT